MTREEQLIEEIKEKDDRIVDLEKSNTELQKEVDEKEEQIYDLKKKVESLEEDLDIQVDEINELDNELSKMSTLENSLPYDLEKETIEDARKMELLASVWDQLTYQQLQEALNIIGIKL